MEKRYLSRIADKILKHRLSVFGAVNVVGPKWCGKSETSKQIANDILKIDKFNSATQEQINSTPAEYISSKRPFFIDEWQITPHIWDFVRNAIDEVGKPGQFILSGSTSTKPQTSHTGTGRINDLIMYPMSLFESGESNGKVSLLQLFENKTLVPTKSSLSLKQIIFAACRGGWPWSILIKSKKLDVAKSYYRDIYMKDIINITDPKTKPSIMKKVLESYARNISTYADNSTLYNDAGIDKDTLTSYLDVLKRLYIVEELEAWSYSLRSKDTIRSQCKREFTDPSIVCAARNYTPEKLLKDMNTFGFIFETLCIRDLRIYSTSLGGELYYYKFKKGKECDCVLVLDDGRYALIEIKVGVSQIKNAIDNLSWIENSIIKNNQKEENQNKKQDLPTLKIVITATDLAYQDKQSGTYIIPIGCLRD